MNSRKNVFRAGAQLSAARIVGQMMAFGRAVVVARILAPEDYGLAATFWMTTSLLATLTELGFQQRLIQASDGDDNNVGAVAQSLFVLRGFLLGAILLLGAGWIAELFKAPDTTWAFRCLALLPIIGGFVHRDLDRFKRSLNFKPEVTASLVAEALTTLAAVPIALMTRDYSAFLYQAILNTSIKVLMSHALAERCFRVAWDNRIVGNFMGFGWPLLINSLLMYGMMQGDRIILARQYTKAELGVYSVALGLVAAVLGLITSGISPVVLPLMARVQDDRKTFLRHYCMHAQIMGVIALVTGTWLVLIGPDVITLVYGQKYAMAGTVIGWLGFGECLRTIRSSGANAALALGDTRNFMYANGFRMIGLILAVTIAWRGMSLQWIAASGVIGEIAALIATVLLLSWRHSLPMHVLGLPSAFVVTCLGVTIAIVESSHLETNLWYSIASFILILSVTFTLYLSFFSSIQQEVRRLGGAVWRRSQFGKARSSHP